MVRQPARAFVPLVALVALIWAIPVQAQETGKRIGEKLDDVGRDVRSGLNRAGQEAKDQFANARTSVQNMGIESRVTARLHWDKALNDATVELAVSQAGVVTLNGSVATARAKTRAVELAQETVGVTEVVDRLAVRPNPAATQAPRSATQP